MEVDNLQLLLLVFLRIYFRPHVGRGFLEWQREQQLLQGQRLPGAAGQGNLTLLLFPNCPRFFAARALITILNSF